MLRPYTDAWPSPIHLQVLPCDQSVRLEVPLARRPDHLRRQRRGRRGARPPGLPPYGRGGNTRRLVFGARRAPSRAGGGPPPEPPGGGRGGLAGPPDTPPAG